ncbi:hypothetical protein [Phenylobacterium montanum]|uniref:Uncharacterized protein n=1 Tax=Phenylobacterium montanum TaxID=2823693 RepID=A0A975IU44_9CAUL|nr:hypothetical protein [Caulobacter sp. S6]QUD87557.1 hypothetical protein KCG34_21295 [Caulobacter sp. S6]
MTTGETLLVLAGSVLGSLLAGVLMSSSGASVISIGIAALIGFDVLGGAVCNGTQTTRAWYHRPGQNWVHHVAFVAPHLAYVILVATLMRGSSFDGRYALIFSVGLVGASAVILCVSDRLKTPVAFSAYLVVLSSITIGVGSTRAMGWFEPALLLKLLLGHLLPNGIPPTKAV